MMTALIVIVTAGEAALPMIAGRWANIVRILKAVDALGDVTTYAAKAGKLPGKAYDHVRGKLGKGAEAAGDGGQEAASVSAVGSSRSKDRQPEVVAVKGYAQGPRLQWAKNPDGAVRSVDEAVEIARRHGVVIPDDILIRKVKGKYMPDRTFAQYYSHRGTDPNKRVSWQDFYDKDLDELLVRIDDAVFQSDEAIVAIMAHEMHELNNLRRLFAETGGSMSVRRLHYLINPGIKGNLHDQAWDVADQIVTSMRRSNP